MLTLFLLRHAKSSWSDASLEDRERTLSKRGRKDAPRMGRFMTLRKLDPGLIVCSTAVRTRETLALLEPELPKKRRKIRYEDALYEVSPSRLIEQIRALPGTNRKVLIIGHNPGMQGAAMDLIGDGDAKDIKRLGTKFPTAALAVITFETKQWSTIRPAAGRLELFVRPKDLDDGRFAADDDDAED